VGRTRSIDYDDVRDTILDRVASIFARRGFAATSITEIADACDCSRSRLYHYFDSKEALLREMLSAHVDLLLERCDLAASRAGDPQDKLRLVVRMFLEVYAVSRDRHVVMLTCLDALPEADRIEIIRKQKALVEFVRGILLEIRPPGPISATDNLDAMLLFGMINWTYTWYDPDKSVSPEALAARTVDIFLKGYVP
jgi:AcrR family transcriptional regulator